MSGYGIYVHVPVVVKCKPGWVLANYVTCVHVGPGYFRPGLKSMPSYYALEDLHD